MHNNTAVNRITGESIPCLKDGDKLYHYAGEGSEPVTLGEQWYVPADYSWVVPGLAVLAMIIGLALMLWRGASIN